MKVSKLTLIRQSFLGNSLWKEKKNKIKSLNQGIVLMLHQIFFRIKLEEICNCIKEH